MNADQTQPSGPDLTKGIDAASLADGAMLLGHIGRDPVMLARSGGEVFAIGATCTRYGGPLAEGLLVGDTVRCPWHHACFSMRTGEAVRAPALNPVACWSVETIDGRHFVRGRHELPLRAARRSSAGTPVSIVILGGGAAAEAALETLRREGYSGRITVLSADSAAPYDRRNLSKDFLAGTASEDWIPLRESEFYRENDAVPFFWSAHYDTQVLYVGHAQTWDRLQIDGSVDARDCRVAFRSAGRTLAVATIGCDLDSLRAELQLEAAGPAQ